MVRNVSIIPAGLVDESLFLKLRNVPDHEALGTISQQRFDMSHITIDEKGRELI